MRTKKVCALAIAAVSTAAMGHPGSHESMSPSEQAAHVLADPWHLALTIAVTVAAIATVRALRRNRGPKR